VIQTTVFSSLLLISLSTLRRFYSRVYIDENSVENSSALIFPKGGFHYISCRNRHLQVQAWLLHHW